VCPFYYLASSVNLPIPKKTLPNINNVYGNPHKTSRTGNGCRISKYGGNISLLQDFSLKYI
jgi:hypothetical protein